ncbi:MAG: membrane dipeptidase [Oscillospiraceae bacterium]
MTIPYFDAHCDTVSALLNEGGKLYNNGFHLDLRRLGAYSPSAQIFAVWGGKYEEKAELLRSELIENADKAVLCRSATEARLAADCGKIAAFLSVEGAEQLDCSPERLRQVHERDGVIMVNLCWNSDNALCGAALDGGGGLTDAGRAFVSTAQEIGVVTDLSHASERTFWDVISQTNRPVVASHSNLKSLCPNPRNLTDAQFKALIACGGGAGLNLCPSFLGVLPDVNACVAHIEAFLELGGGHSLFIGADLDGIESLPRGMKDVESIALIYEALLRRNHGEELLRDIFYNNLMNILERAT